MKENRDSEDRQDPDSVAPEVTEGECPLAPLRVRTPRPMPRQSAADQEEALIETCESVGLPLTKGSAPCVGGTPVTGSVLVILHPFKRESARITPEQGFQVGDWVLIRDDSGEDLGRVIGSADVENPSYVVVHKATDQELQQHAEVTAKAGNALRLFRQLVRQFKLPMKVVDAHLRFDRREITFYFVSDERLNFRALHKAISVGVEHAGSDPPGWRARLFADTGRDWRLRARPLLRDFHQGTETGHAPNGASAEPVCRAGQNLRAVRQTALLSQI